MNFKLVHILKAIMCQDSSPHNNGSVEEEEEEELQKEVERLQEENKILKVHRGEG